MTRENFISKSFVSKSYLPRKSYQNSLKTGKDWEKFYFVNWKLGWLLPLYNSDVSGKLMKMIVEDDRKNEQIICVLKDNFAYFFLKTYVVGAH